MTPVSKKTQIKEERVSIINKTKGRLPSLPFVLLKDDILGKKYNLSVAIVTPEESRLINKNYRGKDYPTNVLSFPLSANEGELILCRDVIKKEAPNFERNFREFFGFLVIHGMLHLDGMEHGSIMDKAEEKYDQKYFNRDRHRNDYNKSSSRGIYQGRKKS